jgi:hypothetical protein
MPNPLGGRRQPADALPIDSPKDLPSVVPGEPAEMESGGLAIQILKPFGI